MPNNNKNIVLHKSCLQEHILAFTKLVKINKNI